MRIGITGQAGFVGEHLTNYLSLQKNVELISFKKSFFEKNEDLEKFVTSCDTIVHLAAMNRHSNPQVIYDTNIKLVNKIIYACESQNVKPTIFFSSSTQETSDNLYGKSKLEGGKLFEDWGRKSGARIVNMVIPNVFGPFGKPNYNSVVATFCHKLTHGEIPQISNDSLLKLVYINELIEDIFQLIFSDQSGKVSIKHRHEMLVSELNKKLTSFKISYLDNGKIPEINDPLSLALFNTYRCYIDYDHYPVLFAKHTDDRGSFVEIIRANTSGQFSFSTTKPSITRGNHFHTRKAERFAVIKGKAKISLRKIGTQKVIDYIIDGESPAYVDMPIWYTHNITNIGEQELITLFWINEPYDQKDPDTYFVNV